MTRLLTTVAALALGLTMGALPAAAQSKEAQTAQAQDDFGTSEEKVNQLIVFGNDPCPASSGNEITVCARKGEEERFRIPEPSSARTVPRCGSAN